jgi:RES domain-containing protein
LPVPAIPTIPWIGTTWRHIPSNRPADATDTTPAASRGDGRWHSAGEHTLYLAGDQPLAIAEFARHLREHRAGVLVRGLRTRFIFEIRVRMAAIIDLRETAIGEALALETDPAWIRDVARTRAIATTVRRESPAEAIVVPSMAFLDDPTRWNLVIFREKLSSWPGPSITVVRIAGVIEPARLLGIAGPEEPR